MKDPKNLPADVLPIEPILSDLKRLRSTFCELLNHYRADQESRLMEVLSLVQQEEEKKSATAERVQDFSEMLRLLRGLEVKPKKGRRRDLKKIETLIDDLLAIAERW